MYEIRVNLHVRLTSTLNGCMQDQNRDYDSYCLLAEAFLHIQQPDKAATAYEVSSGTTSAASNMLHEFLAALATTARKLTRNCGNSNEVCTVFCTVQVIVQHGIKISCDIAAMQSALALRPKDSDLALAAAQALVAAHNYNRAIDYYNRSDGVVDSEHSCCCA